MILTTHTHLLFALRAMLSLWSLTQIIPEAISVSSVHASLMPSSILFISSSLGSSSVSVEGSSWNLMLGTSNAFPYVYCTSTTITIKKGVIHYIRSRGVSKGELRMLDCPSLNILMVEIGKILVRNREKIGKNGFWAPSWAIYYIRLWGVKHYAGT